MAEAATRRPVKKISDEELKRTLWELIGGVHEPELTRANTALLIIDVQYMCADRDFGMGAKADKLGGMEFINYYFDRLKYVTIPNIRRLQATARKMGVEVVHVRIASSTNDGRDNSLRWKWRGRPTPIGSKEAQILPEVEPQGDELVFSKVTESVFNSTNIHRTLQNMGIANLIIVGVVTNGCVEGATRSASDLDYGTILVEDATAAFAPQLQDNAVLSMGHKDAVIKSTDEVIKALEAL